MSNNEANGDGLWMYHGDKAIRSNDTPVVSPKGEQPCREIVHGIL